MATRISTAVDTALVTWITSVVPALVGKVGWDKASSQDSRAADKPALPYAVLNIIAGPTNQTGADFKKVAAQDDYKMTIVKAFTLSITYISNSDFLSVMADLEASLENPINQEQLRTDAGLGILEHFPVIDVSEPLTTKFELRSKMDVRFNYLWQDESLSLGTFDTVTVNPTINGVARDPIVIP